MSFTYTPSTKSNRDVLRLMISDTDQDDHIFEDEELDIILTQEPDLNMAASFCCRSIAINQARQAVAIKIMGDVSIDRTKIPKFFIDLSDKFEKREINAPISYTDSYLYGIDHLGFDISEYKDDDELW